MRASQSFGCCNNIHTGLQYWPCRGHSLQLSIATICDLSIVVAEGHSELWRQKATKRVSVTLQMLWLLGHNELWRPKPTKVVSKLAKNPPNGNTEQQLIKWGAADICKSSYPHTWIKAYFHCRGRHPGSQTNIKRHIDKSQVFRHKWWKWFYFKDRMLHMSN